MDGHLGGTAAGAAPLRRRTPHPSPMAAFPALPQGRFGIVYADPPWDYKGQLQHAGPGSADTGGAARHYPTVTLDMLAALDVPRIRAPDSLLFMWSSSPHLDQAIELGKRWGFAWATVAFVWDKQRVNPGFYTLEPVRALPGLQARAHPGATRRPQRAPAREREARRAFAQARGGARAHRRDVPRRGQDRAVRARPGGGLDRLGARRGWRVTKGSHDR